MVGSSVFLSYGTIIVVIEWVNASLRVKSSRSEMEIKLLLDWVIVIKLVK